MQDLSLKEILNASISGNAATATKLATKRSIGFSGITAAAQQFDGSGDITFTVTAVPASIITGTVVNATKAASADKLTTARSINVSDAGGTHTGTAISFDGSAGGTIKLPATITATLDGNASTADKLKTPRTINGVEFDGSKNISITVQDSSKIPLAGSSSITGNLVPSTNNTRNLGSSSYKWANVYTTNINGQAVLSYEVVDSW